MEAIVKKEIDVILKLSAKEAIALMDFLGELKDGDVFTVLGGNFDDKQKKSINNTLDDIYETLDNLEELVL